ncbi:ABC transporter D family member 2, chloroplastic [Linum perenne]
MSSPSTTMLLIPAKPQLVLLSSTIPLNLTHTSKCRYPFPLNLHLRRYKPPAMSISSKRRRRRISTSCSSAPPTSVPSPPPPDRGESDDVDTGVDYAGRRETPEIRTLFRRFWKVAAPYWFSEDKDQARLQLAAVFALTLATTGISVGFSFLGRDFYNALSNKDQEQFTKQLLYYLGAFAGGIPIFVLRDYTRETLALRWRSWMTKYYLQRYLKHQIFYKIQSQSIIDNPDQRIVDDLSSFTGTALSFALTFFNAAVDLISFSNILYGIYPPLFVVLLQLLISSRNLEFFTSGYRYLIQILPAALVAPMFFSGKIEFGVINQSVSAFNHILGDFSLIVYQFQSISAFSAVIDRLGEFDDLLDSSSSSSLSETLEEITVEYSPIGSLISQESNGSVLMDQSKQLLVVKDLTLQTPRSKTTLIKNLSLVVNKDDHLLVMGPSGSGKTSLLRALAGLWNYGKGEVIFYVSDGEDTESRIADIQGSPRINGNQRDVLFLPQKPYMVLGTLRQQLLYPTWADGGFFLSDDAKSAGSAAFLMEKPESEEACGKPKKPTTEDLIQVLDRVRLSYVLSRFGSLDSIHEWSSVLSLGEQQRLAFARLLLSKPKLVLLDESTSALDENNEGHLYEQIRGAGITYISVGHRRTLVKQHRKVLNIAGAENTSSEECDWHVETISSDSVAMADC